MKKILICGTRKKGYEHQVEMELIGLGNRFGLGNFELIEGCCPDSADAYAEEWAKKNGIKVNHFPSHSGNYLKRNIEMVEIADEVIGFWNQMSYGTAHTIAHAAKKGIPIKIVEICNTILIPLGTIKKEWLE